MAEVRSGLIEQWVFLKGKGHHGRVYRMRAEKPLGAGGEQTTSDIPDL